MSTLQVLRGTQAAWDFLYRHQHYGREWSGLHQFKPRDLVTKDNGDRGTVIAITSLTATVEWNDGRTEEIEQGERSVSIYI